LLYQIISDQNNCNEAALENYVSAQRSQVLMSFNGLRNLLCEKPYRHPADVFTVVVFPHFDH